MKDLYLLSATEISELLAAKKIKIQEYFESLIERVRLKEPVVRSWEYFDEELFAAKGVQADNSFFTKAQNRKLTGIPIGIKDILNTTKASKKKTLKHRGDKTGKSTYTQVSWELDQGYIVAICYDYSKEYGNQDHFEILRKIKKKPQSSQRELAQELGFSLGKLNYCLKELQIKGLIKIENFKKNPNKINYLYVLTPEGLAQKTKLTINFMKRKMKEYDELKKEIEE